jgi:3-hydroxyisobutyrate dehydrogenase-like beta-hydroxyacid dehydrogenase
VAREHLGFIGVGRMGGPMARRLLGAGYRLTVFDTDPAASARLAAAGAEVAGSPAQVASAAEIVLASLPTPAAVEQVAHSVLAGNRIRTFVDLSTSGPKTAAAVAERLAASKIALVDSPVSGGVKGAEKGTLAVMVSGPTAAVAGVQPVLEVFGKVFVVGEAPGLAQTLKLANNMLSACAFAITSEVMVMGVKAGLDPKRMLEVINAGSGRNTSTEDKFPRCVLPRTFDFGFATGLSSKDIRLCVETAAGLGVPMPVGSAVRQMLLIAEAMQGPESDLTSLVKCVEAWAGVEVKARP